jgi:hypothetical protein
LPAVRNIAKLSLGCRDSQLESAYLDQNRREYEIVKHVSLAELDPLALLSLRETGRCELELPEALFDLDYPGHYMRRLRSVSLTIPCVAGPYTGVHCTLTLLRNEVRLDGKAQEPYARDTENEDPRFAVRYGALQSIATSHAQNDAGMFEVNFRDERYLPFEGAGAVSRWRLDMPQATNAFDFGTISNVILQIRYTAREGGERLRQLALAAAELPVPAAQPASPTAELALPAQSGRVQLLSARTDFSDSWHRFLYPAESETAHTLAMALSAEHFPFAFRQRELTVTGVDLFWKLKAGAEFSQGDVLAYQLRMPQGQLAPADPNQGFQTNGPFPKVAYARPLSPGAEQPAVGTWTLSISESAVQALGNKNALRKAVTLGGEHRFRLDPDAIEDLWVLVRYAVD